MRLKASIFIFSVIVFSVLSSSCGVVLREPAPGSLNRAEVAHVVPLSHFREVKAGYDRIGIPFYFWIRDAIELGVTEDEVKAGRLLLLQCAVGRNWWHIYIALEPIQMKISVGEHVEFEAGKLRRYAETGLIPQTPTLSKIIRKIPYPPPKDMLDVWGAMIKCSADGADKELSLDAVEENKAKEGDPEAQLQIYYNLIEKDPVKAHQWLCKSAKAGHALARKRLGLLYENGAEIYSKDIVKAYYWYQLAADSRDYWAGKNADRIKKLLNSQQLSDAKKMKSEWPSGNCNSSVTINTDRK